jgi:hypothetical protein
MSNGHVCCILGVCCPPPAQEKALEAFLDANCYFAPDSIVSSADVARLILGKFDLAPKGAGAHLVGIAKSASLAGKDGADMEQAAVDGIADLYAPILAEPAP